MFLCYFRGTNKAVDGDVTSVFMSKYEEIVTEKISVGNLQLISRFKV